MCLDVSGLCIVSLTTRLKKSYIVSLVKQANKIYFLSFPISSSNDLSDCEERENSRAREEGDTQRVKENVFHLLLASPAAWQFSGALMWSALSTIPKENETTCRVLASPAGVVVALATSFLGEERSLGTRLSVSIDHSRKYHNIP